jgi:alpha-tubulin suppressor-like RCC1 family protein
MCPAVASLAGGDGYACAVLVADGSIRCWGTNDYGRLGDGTETNHLTPTAVKGLDHVIQVATGLYHACAARDDGTVQCWGLNAKGELGDGTMMDHLPPAEVIGLKGVKEIGAGGYHTCALLGTGGVQCWGEGISLGAGSVSSKATPQDVPGLADVQHLAVGRASSFGSTISYSCALMSDGSAQCWGDNSHGQLGDGTMSGGGVPVKVSGLSGAKQLALGGAHACALMSDDTVQCWGENGNGQLGDGTLLPHATPAAVPGLTNVSRVVAGDRHTCALLKDGTVQCWGTNGAGELGRGTITFEPIPVPGAVVGLSGVTVISAGTQSTCAFASDGVTRCWGNASFGQLGNGDDTMSQSKPGPVAW